MERGKTGNFIAECRKEMGYSQKQLAEREYEYQKQEGIEDKPVPFIMIPPPMDAYRKFHPGIIPMRWKDGTEMKLSEMFMGFCKVVSIMLSFFFWIRISSLGFQRTAFAQAVVITSPLIIAGVGLAIHGIYQIVQSRDTYESMDSAKIRTAVGIVLVVVPTIIFWMLIQV